MSEPAEAPNRELREGDFAPDFELPTDDGNTVTLSTLRGQKVVLYFYPKDDTPGCTQEAKDFTDYHSHFEREGTQIIGISKDSIDDHVKFKQKYSISYTLASDENSTVCEAYDTWVEKNMYGKKYMGIRRDTFLINSAGKIHKIWRKVKVDGHAEEVLEAARGID